VYIEWVDAVSDGGWEDDIKVDIHPVRTVGFLVSESKDGICLASTVSGEMTNARMHIPKAWITKRKVIKLETKKVQKVQRNVSASVGQPDMRGVQEKVQLMRSTTSENKSTLF